MKERFEKIVVLGSGTLFLDCLEEVKRRNLPYMGLDSGEGNQSSARMRAEFLGLNYKKKDKAQVMQFLREQSEKILLFSIINPWILPGDILEKPNLFPVNCHQALLPRNKGRNAEAWSIFQGDSCSGVTWHKMTPQVDQGEYLWQKQIPITQDTTSLALFREQMKAAYEGFVQLLPLLWEGRISYIQPLEELEPSFHLSREVPAQGILDLNWSFDKISRFLRAMNYGGLKVFPPGLVEYEGRWYTYGSYVSTKTEDERPERRIWMEGDSIYIEEMSKKIRLRKCREAEAEGELL